MPHMTLWQDCLKTVPLVAILRGITPSEVIGVTTCLIEAGIRIIEVPLNSPEAFVSIEKLVQSFGDDAIIGAGTVLRVEDVQQLAKIGAQVSISPNTNLEVIRCAKALGLISMPAFFTPTEAFAAIEAGCDALKLFPAEIAGPQGLKAMKAVLPKTMPVFPVGGVDGPKMHEFIVAGAAGFGFGTALYKPGDSAEVVKQKAIDVMNNWKATKSA